MPCIKKSLVVINEKKVTTLTKTRQSTWWPITIFQRFLFPIAAMCSPCAPQELTAALTLNRVL